MPIRKYDKSRDEDKLMQMISEEPDWDYASEHLSGRYILALESSITYVACIDDVLCGFVRSLEDFGTYIYVCDLLVKPGYRGQGLGRKLMEGIYRDYPDHTVFVMSDVDEYYEKLNYQRIGSIFEVTRLAFS